MKALKPILKTATAGIAVAVLIFSTGCAKEENRKSTEVVHPPEQRITDPGLIAEIDNQVQNMPKIAWYNSTMDKYIVLDPTSETKSVEFVEPEGPRGTIANAAEILFAEGLDAIDSHQRDIDMYNQIQFNKRARQIIEHSQPSNSPNNTSSNGLVVIGNSNLEINHVETLTPDSETEIPDLGVGTPNLSGATVKVGISGNPEALTTTEFQSPAQVLEQISGIILYVVYANAALGNFAILNWFDYLYESSSYLHGMSFVLAYTFTALTYSIYLSQGGMLNATHGLLQLSNAIFYATTRRIQELNDSGNGSGKHREYRENVRGYAFQTKN